MKAWQIHENGEPADVLRLTEVPVPEPGDGQIVVRVRASALNFPDVLLSRGQYQVRPPLPFTPGVELCGDVVTTGPGTATRFTPGDRVIGTAVLPHGSLAEFTVMDEADAFPAPASLDDSAAASVHIAYQTAWFALHRRARLTAGETLLVHAAAGGVGSAAVQLGKAAGAKVVAVVGGADKVEVAQRLGADTVIDRRAVDLIPALKESLGRHGADVVFDPVGGDSYTASTKCIAFEGRIVVVGFASGTIPTPPLSHPLVKNYSVLGLHWGLYKQADAAAVAEAHVALTALSDEGVVAPLVSERLAFDDVPDGLARLGAGSTVGRLVVLLP